MHACGHDGHASIVLGAIWALDAAQAAGELPRPVSWRAVFQPAEETNRGAIEMASAGAVDGAAAIVAAHMDPSRQAGTVGVRAGAFTADCVEIRMRIVGRGGHAARPHESLDPIAVAAQLISSIYLFVPRTTDAQDPIVVSFGMIHGGTTPNAIPDEVHVAGTLRTYRAQTRQRAEDHIRKLSRALAEASDTQIDVEYIEGPPGVENDPALTSLIRREASALLGANGVQEIPRPSMGGEDFANYLDRLPGAMFRLGCASGPKGAPPLHSPMFDLDPEALRVGAKLLARIAVAWSEPTEN
jgi:amidohydrolase